MSKNTGGSAFPFWQVSEATGQPINGFFDSGMTLRDYFAAKADLSKFEVNSESDAEFLVGRPMPRRTASGYEQIKWQADLIAAIRYIMADAMLAARDSN